MPCRQGQRRTAHTSGQLAKCDHRAGKRHSTDQDTDVSLDVMYGQFDPGNAKACPDP